MIRAFGFFAIATALLLYGNALEAPYQLDDQQVLEVAARPNSSTRPLGYATFWLSGETYNVFARVLPWQSGFYHRLVNVLIHALAATSLFWLALELTSEQLLAAWLAGIFFLVHPIQTQATVYISQRFESLAALFMFVSAAAYVRFRRRRGLYWLAVFIAAGFAGGTAEAFFRARKPSRLCLPESAGPFPIVCQPLLPGMFWRG